MARMAIKRIHTTVYLNPDVIHILDGMEKATGNNRSQLINDAVRGEYSWRPKVGEMFREAFTAHRQTVMGEVRDAYQAHCEEMRQLLVDELTNHHASQNNLIKKSKRVLNRSNQY